MERLYLDVVKNKIKAESDDQVKDWCKKRNLKIYDEGFAAFVFDFEFELAYDFEYIVMLIEEYETDWFNYYTNRVSKTHIPPSRIIEIAKTFPAIKNGTLNNTISSNILAQSDKSVFSIKEAADTLGVCSKTIRNQIKAGRLQAEKSNAGKNNHYRISKKSLDEYLANNNAPTSRQDIAPANKNFRVNRAA